jgi:hypothetical protein
VGPLTAYSDFLWMPPDIATCMYYTGLDPFTGQEVYVARHLKDRKLQRALLQFFKPENYFEVRQALLAAGRGDLIGSGCDCLIPANPPRAALQARMAKARRDLTEGRYFHTVEGGDTPKPGRTGTAPPAGYRPHRKSARKNKQRPR